MSRLLRWFRDSFLGIKYGLIAIRSNIMSINASQSAQTITVIDDAFTLSIPAVPDILHNTGDVFIITSLLTHLVLTKDIYLQTIIRMPAWIFLALMCSSSLRLRDDRCAILQELFRLGIILYYGLKLNFSYKFPRIISLNNNNNDELKEEVRRSSAVKAKIISNLMRKISKSEKLLPEDEIQQFYKGVPTIVRENEPVAYQTIPFDKSLEIPAGHFTTNECLRQRRIRSHNGTCFQVMLNYNNKKIRASIKTSIPGDVESLRGLMKEIKLLSYVGQHDNLQTIFGACTKEIHQGNLFLILENCGNRTLEMHLKDIQKTETPLSIREDLLIDFYRWAYEISSGMKFMSSKHIVHGMLTCECILVNEVGTVKLTDYGTVPYLTDAEKFKPEEMENESWKYLAPEAIVKNEFTSSADVWSFGIVLWKIFTINSDPFPAFKEYSTIFPLGLLDGMRPDPDNRIPNYTSDLLSKCWLSEAERRPDFDTCCQYLYVKTKPKRRIVTCDDFIT